MRHDRAGLDLRSSEAGVSLVSVIMGAGLLGVLALAASRNFLFELKKVDHIGQRQELTAVMRNITEGMDCAGTLGIDISKSPPGKAVCSKYKGLKPKAVNGKDLSFGDWDIRADCAGDELVFFIQSGPKDNLRGKSWSDSTNKKDIFQGASDFCRSFFSQDVPFTWKLAGMYTQNMYWLKTSMECRYPNSLTGTCSCPTGFRPQVIYDFSNPGCNNNYYRDEANGGVADKISRGCGILQFLCVREQ